MKLPSRIRGLVVAALCGTGCATVVPMQPASVLAEGETRVAAQLSVAPWCGVGGGLAQGCAYNPGGTPLPDARVGVRRGFGSGLEAGVSAHATGFAPPGTGFEPALRGGLWLEGKKEVWSREVGPGQRQVLSVGPGLGVDLVSVRPMGLHAFAPEVLLGLPVYFGHQTEGFEWVVRAAFLERLAEPSLALDGRPPRLDVGELELSVALLRRPPGHWGVSLGYRAPTGQLAGGAFSLGFGWSFGL
ncbi:MAG TPA: hypothetical protein VK447_17440 [Myxococcaceae bacterium]|nr:hypothetical protein [Myxococcaceae bacterium]